jgi:hypothetical protein
MTTEETAKKEYTAPQLIVYGTVQAITQGSRSGESLDRAFGAGSHISTLTFS